MISPLPLTDDPVLTRKLPTSPSGGEGGGEGERGGEGWRGGGGRGGEGRGGEEEVRRSGMSCSLRQKVSLALVKLQ